MRKFKRKQGPIAAAFRVNVENQDAPAGGDANVGVGLKPKKSYSFHIIGRQVFPALGRRRLAPRRQWKNAKAPGRQRESMIECKGQTGSRYTVDKGATLPPHRYTRNIAGAITCGSALRAILPRRPASPRPNPTCRRTTPQTPVDGGLPRVLPPRSRRGRAAPRHNRGPRTV